MFCTCFVLTFMLSVSDPSPTLNSLTENIYKQIAAVCSISKLFILSAYNLCKIGDFDVNTSNEATLP